jgi:uncharacterized protein (DUF433 family)
VDEVGPRHAPIQFLHPIAAPIQLVDRLPAKGYDARMDDQHIITVESGKRSGQPCVRGMRITVRDVLEYLAGGMSVEELLADFPELSENDVRACLAYAARHLPGPTA